MELLTNIILGLFAGVIVTPFLLLALVLSASLAILIGYGLVMLGICVAVFIKHRF